jgi:hypothetical protein
MDSEMAFSPSEQAVFSASGDARGCVDAHALVAAWKGDAEGCLENPSINRCK